MRRAALTRWQTKGETSSSGGMGGGYFTFTVGKLDAGMAILIGDRASQIEFPSLLLPPECTTGSVVRISVSRNKKEEQRKKREFDELQQDVLETFGQASPMAPALTLRAVTQTSITLEWDKLNLATAKLLSLDIFRNNERLAAIPNPLNNTSTKLSGLEVNKPYSFHLLMRTTAGTFTSNVIKTKTHDMNDTSGISVCFGYMDGSSISEDGSYVDGELERQSKEMLQTLGAKWSDKIQIDTTHFVCTHPRSRASQSFGEGHPAGQMRGAMFSKAAQLSIPIVLPHWIYACIEQKKMVPISHYYMDKEPPNAAKVKQLIGPKTLPASDADVSPKQTSGAFDSAQATRAESSAALAAPIADDDTPPTPISKAQSVDAPRAEHEDHTMGEGREPDAHPEVSELEGPATTTVAVSQEEHRQDEAGNSLVMLDDGTPAVPVSADDGGDARDGPNQLTTSESTGGLSAGADDGLETISLGGGESVKGGDATEEIDLS